MLKDYQSKIIGLLIRQELQLAELYQLLADQHPDHRELWLSLCHEELEHATWIEHFAELAVAGKLHFREGSVKTYTLQAFLSYLAELINLVRKGTMPFGSALSLAMDIEKSLIESKVFEHFVSEGGSLADTFATLKDKTRDHIARLRSYWIRNNSLVAALAH